MEFLFQDLCGVTSWWAPVTLVSYWTDQQNQCFVNAQTDKRPRTADVQICRGSNGQRVQDKIIWCYNESFLNWTWIQEVKLLRWLREADCDHRGELEKNLVQRVAGKSLFVFLAAYFSHRANRQCTDPHWKASLFTWHYSRKKQSKMIRWWIIGQMNDELYLKRKCESLDLSEICLFCYDVNAFWQVLDAVEKMKLSNNRTGVPGKQLNIPCLHFFLLFSSNFNR